MFSGSMVALVTPFRKGDIDIEALRNLIELQISSGTDGILVCGTTGEGTLITHKERDLVIKTAIQTANKRVPIIVGCSSTWPAETIPLIKHAEELGADGALVITPYYIKPSQVGIANHFAVIHDNTNIPIIMYNNPGRCKVNMSVEVILELSKLPRIVALKDTDTNLARISFIKDHIPEFTLLSGDDASYLGFLAHGGDGCISVTANIVPELMKQLYVAWRNKNIDETQRIDRLLAPLHQAMFLESSPAPVKYALAKLGYISNEIRLPLVTTTEPTCKRIDLVLEKVKNNKH